MVIKDTHSKSIYARACPAKCAHDAVVAKIVDDLNVMGEKRVRVRTDGEPPILSLWQKVQ